MGSESWRSDLFGGSGRIFAATVAASLMVTLLAAASRAGDVSDLSGNTLSITNSVSHVLPQGAAAAGALPQAAPPPPGGEESWLSGLHISGYGSQTFGIWQNPTNLITYTPSRNNLAVSRSLLQIDENYRLNENNTFFARQWFVYEPPYSFNSANNSHFAAASNYVGVGGSNPFCIANPKCFRTAAGGISGGARENGIYNTYELRDAWWENKTGPLTLFLGNQIVVWGQSLAFRVGDVVNPTNTCWAFGFANLEQSRVPQWMFHPILNLPEWGPLTSNFLELVVQPGFQPNWQPQQYNDPFRKYRTALTAGRANPCLPSVSHGPSGRFDVQYPTQPQFPGDFITSPVGPYASAGSNIHFQSPSVQGITTPEVAHEFWLCSPFNALGVPAFNPYKAYVKRFPQGLAFPVNSA